MPHRGQKIIMHYGNRAINTHRFWVSRVFANGRFQIDSLHGVWYTEEDGLARQWNHPQGGSDIVAELVA